MDETSIATQPDSPVSLPVPDSSQALSEKASLNKLLTEARNTKEVLDHFRGAIHGGRFDGGAMLALAQGLAFLDAIRQQNMNHIQNLQERLKGDK